MAILLSIDTALPTASVCLSKDEQVLGMLSHPQQLDHAAWLHTAIKSLMDEQDLQPHQLEGITVSIGPGSYTGLRIGLATAKGLCYALNIPLMAVNTLELIASAAKNEAQEWICPMIDARRMEVFTAIYDKNLTMISLPSAMVLDKNSFANELSNHNLTFCGSGVKKIREILDNPHINFSDKKSTAADLAKIGLQHFTTQRFADLAYTEPFYLKDFHTTQFSPH